MTELNMNNFNIGDKVVYPFHGVGEIVNTETRKIFGSAITFYIIQFINSKMKMDVPINKVNDVGLRHLIDKTAVFEIFQLLQDQPERQGRVEEIKVMWNRKSQDYVNKINSGNLLLIAKVLKELHINAHKERSYSERLLYQSALNKIADEVSVIEEIKYQDAIDKLETCLRNSNIHSAL